MYEQENIESANYYGITLPAWLLQLTATAVSAIRDHPGFVPDNYLHRLSGDDLNHPDADPVNLAAELCTAGMWERVDGGYHVLNTEAVQACVDRVREIREEEAARRARVPEPEHPPSASRQAKATAAGVTRFGQRVANGAAASFRCAACGEMAAVIKVARAGTAVDMGPPIGRETYNHDGLVVDYFLGAAWHAADTKALDAVQTVIDGGAIDPLILRQVNWDLAPFYCPDCELNYCSKDWHTCVVFDDGFYDCTIGRCPNEHEHVVDD